MIFFFEIQSLLFSYMILSCLPPSSMFRYPVYPLPISVSIYLGRGITQGGAVEKNLVTT